MQLSGDLAKVNMPNLLQLVRTGGFTGKLSLVQGVKHATLLILDGLPLSVELEGESGIDALLELFLWSSGTFAFSEEKVEENKRNLDSDTNGFNLDEVIKDGMLYVKQKKLLDDMNIQPSTILKQTGGGISAAKMIMGSKYLNLLDGEKSLKEALSSQQLSRREYVRVVSHWLEDGLAEFAEIQPDESSEINLPTWVLARLKQDNSDLTKAIIDMVIWVDRVKCWMYQADAEFYETRKQLAIISDALNQDDDKALEESDNGNEEEETAFAPPEPPPEEDPQENKQPRFDTLFNSPANLNLSRQSPSGHFQLSSSFIGGAGGKFLGSRPSFLHGQASSFEDLGFPNQSSSETKKKETDKSKPSEES